MSRSRKCIESLKGQLGRLGITAPETLPAREFTALVDDALEYISGGDGFREFNSFFRVNTDGSTTFSEVWTSGPPRQQL